MTVSTTAVETEERVLEASCRHCGTRFRIWPGQDEEFCCAGCRAVNALIAEEGFERFYDLRGGKTLPPVGDGALRETDWDWLSELSAEVEAYAAEKENEAATLALQVRGLSCAACVWLIENLFRRQPGALRILVDA